MFMNPRFLAGGSLFARTNVAQAAHLDAWPSMTRSLVERAFAPAIERGTRIQTFSREHAEGTAQPNRTCTPEIRAMARQRTNVPFSSEPKSSSPLPPSSVGVRNAFAPQTALRIAPRDERATGSHARVLFSPNAGNNDEIDLSHALTSAVAYALWRSRGGSAETNWADAQVALEHLVATIASRGTSANAGAAINTELKPDGRSASTRH